MILYFVKPHQKAGGGKQTPLCSPCPLWLKKGLFNWKMNFSFAAALEKRGHSYRFYCGGANQERI